MNWQRILDFFLPESGDVAWQEKLFSGLTAFVGMAMVAWVSQTAGGTGGLLFMAASMGSAAVLLFATPHAPQAQPWALIGGHLVSATIGVFCAQVIPEMSLAAAAAVALSILAMFFLRCLHPPGGAAALGAVLGGSEILELGYGYVLMPVGLNVLVVLVVALIVNNILPGRRYPLMAASQKGSAPGKSMEWAFGRTTLTDDDLEAAMSELDTYVDADRQDLQRIYSNAMMNAYKRRLGQVRCADIMTKAPLAFDADISLDSAWEKLMERDVKGAPVIDSHRHVLGMITTTDLMKHAVKHPGHSYGKRFVEVINGDGAKEGEKETVSDIMSREVMTAGEQQHIVDTIALFNSKRINHVPVVDADERLVGILTRSDVMRSLLLVRS